MAGKTSTTNKRYRLLKELQAHMSLRVSANKSEVRAEGREEEEEKGRT